MALLIHSYLARVRESATLAMHAAGAADGSAAPAADVAPRSGAIATPPATRDAPTRSPATAVGMHAAGGVLRPDELLQLAHCSAAFVAALARLVASLPPEPLAGPVMQPPRRSPGPGLAAGGAPAGPCCGRDLCDNKAVAPPRIGGKGGKFRVW
jgi:hypothetical protein